MDHAGCGHGHVFRTPGGHKAPCGGPGVCQECDADLARLSAAAKRSGIEDFEAEIQAQCDRAREAT
jgi:hypothetical protein